MNKETQAFARWLLMASHADNENRILYVAYKDCFIDDKNNRYTWEQVLKLFQDDN